MNRWILRSLVVAALTLPGCAEVGAERPEVEPAFEPAEPERRHGERPLHIAAGPDPRGREVGT